VDSISVSWRALSLPLKSVPGSAPRERALWTQWRREESLAPAGNKISIPRSSSLQLYRLSYLGSSISGIIYVVAVLLLWRQGYFNCIHLSLEPPSRSASYLLFILWNEVCAKPQNYFILHIISFLCFCMSPALFLTAGFVKCVSLTETTSDVFVCMAWLRNINVKMCHGYVGRSWSVYSL
jgi:hypothetical protein